MGFFDDFFDFVGDIFQEVISWIIPIPEIPDIPQQEQAKGTLVNKQSNNAQIPVIYGERLVGGTRVFLETSGTDNQYLYGAIVLGEGEVNAITQVKVDDEVVTFDGAFADGSQITSTGERFGTTITIQPFYGSAGQSASSLLTTLSSWGANHKLSGLCYIAFRITWDADKFQGIPKIQAKVQGKKVVSYNASLVAQSPAYSSNPAWCLLDYLTDTTYGKGINIADIDLQSFYNASQTAITQVTPYSGGSDINLFDCNAVIDTQQKIIDNVRFLLRGMRGFLPYTQGKYKLILEESGSASLNLNKDNIIGGIKLSSEKKNEKYNRININYINPEKNYEVDTVVYPETDAEHQTLKTEDGGFLQEFQLDLQMITNPYQALEFGKVVLQRSRNQLGLTLTANYSAMDLAIGDIVSVTDDILGMSAKPFRVVSMSINLNYTVQLSLIEHQSSWYTWEENNEQPVVPDTNLPNPFTVQPPASITLSDELIEYAEGITITRLNIDITPSTDNFVRQYLVEAKLDTETNFKVVGQGDDLNYELLNVIDDRTYNVRVKAINSLGVSSAFITADRKIVGATEPPQDVSGFNVNYQGSNQMQLNWLPNNDLDISYYEIRYQNVTSNAQWNKSVNWLQVPRTSGTSITTNARTGAFLIKAVDKLGNESNNETIIFSNIITLENFKDIQTQTETLGNGTFDSNLALSDGFITLDTTTQFDDVEGDFDDATGLFDLGGGTDNINSEGFYTLEQTYDAGGTFDVSFTKNVEVEKIENPFDLFDDGRGADLFDDAPAPFDGNDPTTVTINLQVASSTTSFNDATEFFNMNTTSTIKGRYFKFRLRLANTNNRTQPFISGISFNIQMQKRQEIGDDIDSGTSTKTITFTNPFFAIPSLGIALQNAQTGDYYTISNKTASSFDIDIYNSSDTNIDRKFDYIAIGHGIGA